LGVMDSGLAGKGPRPGMTMHGPDVERKPARAAQASPSASSQSLSLMRGVAEPIKNQAAKPAAAAPPSAAMICMIQEALPIGLFACCALKACTASASATVAAWPVGAAAARTGATGAGVGGLTGAGTAARGAGATGAGGSASLAAAGVVATKL
jgi:hypothetical protein